LLSLGATDVEVPAGSPDFTDRKQVRVAASSKVVTSWTAAVRTLDRLSSPC